MMVTTASRTDIAERPAAPDFSRKYTTDHMGLDIYGSSLCLINLEGLFESRIDQLYKIDRGVSGLSS
jgi:hypothetical protein